VKTKKLADEVLEKAFLKIWNDCVTLECVKRNLFIWMYSITYKIAKSELEESKQQPSHVHKLVA
jgi:DNA-directed RNA polymerase specialized sigma24 family protein